jgi:hypothetical protein
MAGFNVQVSEAGVTPVVTKHLITEYGEISLDKVRTKAVSVAAAKDRDTQDDDHLFTYLMGSLNKAARDTVNLRKDDFTVGDEHSGIQLLKIIIAKTQVNTRATINLLMGKLHSGLGDMMATHNNNITAFNTEVNEIMRKLQSRGKSCEDLDLIPQLLVTYMACGTNDTPFYRYIESLENKNNDGDIDLTTKGLMEKAETKYEELKDKNKFLSKSIKGLQESGDDIVALRAEIEEIKTRGITRTSRRTGRSLPDWVTKKPTNGRFFRSSL